DGARGGARGVGAERGSGVGPDIPTRAGVGLPGFELNSWYGVWAPKGTPKEIQATLNTLVQDTMRDPAVVKRLTATLIEPIGESIDASKAFIRSEIVRAGELLKSVNFQPA